MGESVPNDHAGHALLILRALRAGIAQIDDHAEHITVGGERYRIHLYTDDGSCLTGELAWALRDALDEA